MANEDTNKAPTDKEKAAQAAKDRAAQDAKDRADLRAAEDELEAENAGPGGSAHVRRQQLQRRIAERAAEDRKAEATVEAVVARGRTLFLDPGQTQPFGPGSTVMLTPEEHAKLVASGHVQTDDGDVIEPVGPKVLNEAGLIQGHSVGQGTKPASSSGSRGK